MKRRIAILLILLAVGLTAFFYYFSEQKNGENGMHIAFLDVGQGDAAYIRFPNGEDMLVDCGKDRRVLAALGRQMRFFDRTIDYLVVTHPDVDHYGGCTDVLKRFIVKKVVHNNVSKNYDEVWRYFWQTVERERADIVAIGGETQWQIASATIHFLYPNRDISDIRLEGKRPEINDTSIVFLLTYANATVLFTGDAEFPLENYLVETYGETLDIDILKVGHHGSPGSTGEEFVQATTPGNAVISVGHENRYGHPSLRVIRRLERAGSHVWRTDEMGDIIAALDGEGAMLRSER